MNAPVHLLYPSPTLMHRPSSHEKLVFQLQGLPQLSLAKQRLSQGSVELKLDYVLPQYPI